MLTLERWLPVRDALDWIRARQPVTERRGVDFDPLVIASGYASSGAGLYRPGSPLTSVEPDSQRGGVLVDGDLFVDGPVDNQGLVFVWGNVAARSVSNSGVLVVAGSLTADRFLGADEVGLTLVLGDCHVTSAVTLWSHSFGVWGHRLAPHVDDEDDREAAYALLAEWQVIDDPAGPIEWDDSRARLRRWASTRGPLPAEMRRPFQRVEPEP